MPTSTNKICDHFRKVDTTILEILINMNLSLWINPKIAKKEKLEYFQSLCRQIISQQLSGKAADTIQGRFEALFPKKIVTPEKLLEHKDQTLRDAGMSWAKASYIKNIATAILSDDFRWNDFHKLSDEDVIAELTKIKGVGRWTAEMFLMFTLGREDVFSHGDIGLRRGIENLYNLENPSKKKIECIVSVWKPYRTYGSIALWQSLEK